MMKRQSPAINLPIETLRFEKATFAYEGSPPVFDSLDLQVPTDRCVYITGQNGGGQSTLLKLIAVLQQPQSGKFLINGLDTTEMTFEDFLPFRMNIAYTFDLGGLFANRTLIDNLTLPLLYHKICSPEEAEARARAIAKEFEFERQLQNRPALVSGGLRKLTCVLRGLMSPAQMLVMDDPFTAIGPEASRRLVRLIQERREAKELRHVFMTSREDVWPHWLGCDQLILSTGGFRYEESGKAA